MEVLQLDRQALWSSLRASVAQRFDYWCQLALPSAVKPVAALLDKKLWLVLDAALGFKVPRRGGLVGQDVDCILNVPVNGLEEQPFAEWVVRQPVRLHGMGLRSQEDNCDPGYVGALLQAAPFMAKLPALKDVMEGTTFGKMRGMLLNALHPFYLLAIGKGRSSQQPGEECNWRLKSQQGTLESRLKVP